MLRSGPVHPSGGEPDTAAAKPGRGRRHTRNAPPALSGHSRKQGGDSTMKPRALLVSVYNAASHAQWARGLMRTLDEYDWRFVTLPARHFSWRIRGNALSLLDPGYSAEVDCDPRFIVATSMLDLTTARALLPGFSRVPVLLYCHENQFDYPHRGHDLNDVQLLTIKSALAADRVVFNSEFNRMGFINGATTLLQKMPDAVPPDLLSGLAAKCSVLPVPLDPDTASIACVRRRSDGPLRLVWNHRWEYDKGVDRLVAALHLLRAEGVAFELHVCGQQFRTRPAAFAELEQAFRAELRTFGYISSRAEYLALLARMDVVVSTALHEFQGLAVLEAMALGCVPAVPDRLAYREFVPPSMRYTSFIDDPARDSAALAALLTRYAQQRGAAEAFAPPSVHELSWSHMAPRYRQCIAALQGSAAGAVPGDVTIR